MCDGNLLQKMKVKSPMTQLQPSNFNTLLNEIKSTMMSITSVITSPIVTAPLIQISTSDVSAMPSPVLRKRDLEMKSGLQHFIWEAVLPGSKNEG